MGSEVFDDISKVFNEQYEGTNAPIDSLGYISLENDIFTKIAGQGKVFAYVAEQFWMAIKSAGSALYANRVQLELYKKNSPQRLTHDDSTVFIHPSAQVDPSAKLGPYAKV